MAACKALGNSVRVGTENGRVVVQQDGGDGRDWYTVATFADNRSPESWALAQTFARALVRVTEAEFAVARAYGERKAHGPCGEPPPHA